MRVFLVIVIGGAAALIAYAFSEISGGLWGATTLMLSLLLVPVTAGVAIGLWITPDMRYPPYPARIGTKPTPRCGSCRQRRIRVESVWVCATCDHVPAGR